MSAALHLWTMSLLLLMKEEGKNAMVVPRIETIIESTSRISIFMISQSISRFVLALAVFTFPSLHIVSKSKFTYSDTFIKLKGR